jgi:hypothetical protein
MITEQQKENVRKMIRGGRNIEAIKYLKDTFGITLIQAKQLVDQLSLELKDEIQPDVRRAVRKVYPLSLIIGGIFSFIGLLFLAISTIVYISNSNFKDSAVKVTGVVVNFPHQPLIEYYYGEQLYNFRASTSSNPPSYTIGEKVDIFVNPENPQEAIIDNFLESYLMISIFGGLGFFFFIAGSAALFLTKKS